MRSFRLIAAALLALAVASESIAAPAYNIINLGTAQSGDGAASGQAISVDGHYAAGFSAALNGTGGVIGDHAFVWNDIAGTTGLPNLASPARAFNFGRGVNNAGTVVGFGATTAFFSSPVPVIWKNGIATQLPLPSGQTLGHAYSVNNSELIAGSVGGGATEFACTYTASTVNVFSQTLPGGGRLQTAFGINGSGRVVGNALDPNNAAVTHPFYLDPGDSEAHDIGFLSGDNGGLAFAVSSNGFITGGSQLNQGSARPYLWTPANGMTPVPLPNGLTVGSGRGVNANGWVVGTASGQFAVPFLFDGTQSYDLQTLIPPGSGWTLDNNTSSAALGISDNNIIVGQGVFNGVISAYVMVPVPEPAEVGALIALTLPMMRRRK